MSTPDNFSVESCAWLLVLVLVSAVEGFALIPARNEHGPCSSPTRPQPPCFARSRSRSRSSQAAENTISRRIQPLRMGKGFNSAKSKQLELAKKMALAKKQQQPDQEQQKGEEATSADDYDEEEQRLQQDRARFAELLRTSKVSNPNPLYEDDELDSLQQQSRRSMQSSLKASVTARAGALKAKRSSKSKAKKSQKKDSSKISKVEREKDEDQPLQEGDTARRHDFEGLISCETGAALGPIVSAQLVPWVPPFTAEYLIILADPRAQSSDLRRAIQYISSNASPDILQQVIAINSDEVNITKSWIDRTKTQRGDDGSDTEGDAALIHVFSDRNWEWMRRYSAVDNGRWSMSMMVIDSDAVIRRVVRDVDPSQACQLLAEAIESIK